jgi:phospholipase/carboxylesterase
MFVLAAFLALAQSPTSPAAPAAPVAAAAQGRLLPLPDEAVAYIPASAGPKPPLLVLLHGAGRTRLSMIERFKPEAEKRGIVLLAPTSRGITWDLILNARRPAGPGSVIDEKLRRRFGRSRDTDRVEAAIKSLAATLPIDRAHIVLAGFSDGATFALAMGMQRAYDFSAVIAWSPGIPFESEQPARRRRVFVSHGRQDPVLKFEVDCGEIVPLLRDEGASVTFVPFEGVHELPKPVAEMFLDAAFGPAPGAALHPLPADLPECRAGPGAREIPVY